jgi:hypothetical protein
MPMMAVYEQNDALTSARLLTSMTLDELQGREEVEESVMVDMFHLLDGYRSHGFYGLRDEEDGRGDDFAGSSMLRSGERRLGDVRMALQRTVTALGKDGDAVLNDVETALRAAAYPDEERADEGVLRRAVDFLVALISNLRISAT